MVTKLKDLKVSILIANYNNEKFLKECIGSIKNQTYKNIEIIFHDDFSSDNSIKTIIKYKNIKIIKNKLRSEFGSFNQMSAYQRAFKKSTGEIIFFLDSDDSFSRRKIEIIRNIYLKNKNISAIFDLPIFQYPQKLKYQKKKNKILKNFWPYIPPQSCISIRRSDFKKVISVINFSLFPDIWMDFRIAIYLKYISKNFFILNKNLTYYRQSSGTVSSKFGFLSSAWWKRRMQAHKYIKYFFNKYKIRYQKNLDYFLTLFIQVFIK
jgi:glycosyltransferase involved in cell wall biosynthesis